jgi:short subunit dehydrogenase-like uncharacterized protein
MNAPRPWVLYGAAGHTGAMLASHAVAKGHHPVLAGRSELPLVTLAQRLDLPYRVVSVRVVEETLFPGGATWPAAAFGVDFVPCVEHTHRTESIPAEV